MHHTTVPPHHVALRDRTHERRLALQELCEPSVVGRRRLKVLRSVSQLRAHRASERVELVVDVLGSLVTMPVVGSVTVGSVVAVVGSSVVVSDTVVLPTESLSGSDVTLGPPSDAVQAGFGMEQPDQTTASRAHMRPHRITVMVSPQGTPRPWLISPPGAGPV